MFTSPPRLDCEPQNWDSLARLVGCKIDARTQRFVKRLLKPEDAARTTYDDDGYEELLRLGRPSLAENFDEYQWEPMVRHWGLQVLNAAGFINGQVPPEYVAGYNPQGSLHDAHFDDPLHPLLRRDKWDLTDEEWDLILPGLHLATALLDEPEVLRFLASYFTRWTTQFSQELGHDVKLLQIPRTLTLEQNLAVWRRLYQLRLYTDFVFKDDDDIVKVDDNPATGMTTAVSLTATRPGTWHSMISINRTFLDVLREQKNAAEWDLSVNDYQNVHNVDEDRKIHIDGPSSRLRTLCLFAQTILHELNHAVAFAFIPVDPAHTRVEPFFPGDLEDECGFAFDKFIWNGMTSSFPEDLEFDMAMNMAAPYGMQIYPQPTSWVPGAENVHHSRWQLPVPAFWVCSLVSRELWEHNLPRFGASELRCPLAWEWAVNPNPTS